MERGKDTKRSHEYELGHTDWELKRLETQAKLVDPMTRRYFLDAGLAPGMRVLDIGSGGGDVAILAAAIVGASGEVVGSDRSPVAVAAASARVARLGFSNVSFREGDPTMMDFEQPFDAIVGRYVLMFSPDATAMLKGLVRQVKPGGIVVFHEVDWTGAKSSPPSPTYDCCHAWIVQTFQKVGTNPVMGLNLHAAFLAAGLPAPTLGLSALAGAATMTSAALT